MIVVPPVIELGHVAVVDPGTPNQERIVFRPTEQINLALCGILVGVRGADGITPVSDLFFWFGEVEVRPPGWIIVFTGNGAPRTERDQAGNPVHIFYWGRESTLFNFHEVVPILYRVAGITFGQSLKILPSFRTGTAPLKP